MIKPVNKFPDRISLDSALIEQVQRKPLLGTLCHEYTRSDLVQKQIEEAVKERWLALRNKIIDELQDQMATDQLQEVLQIVDDEQWFPCFAKAIRNGEAEEVVK